MAPVDIKFVVSFSSQDENHCVHNLTKSAGFKKWLSHPKEKSGRIEAIFQLETDCIISYVDVGSVWCALLEVQVGRSDWPQNQPYITLISTCSIMTPLECRQGQSYTKTRMFGPNEFSMDVAQKKWDRVKVICLQPFRKDVQFGLSFLHIKSSSTSSISGSRDHGSSSGHKSVKLIKKHFFGKSSPRKEDPAGLKSRLLKIAGSCENGTEQAASLSRTAKLVLAATDQRKTISDHAQSSTNNRPTMYSNHIAQKYGPKFETEVLEFLATIDVNENELDNITFADLRHKFERKKKRKLTPEEKKSFFKLAKTFICSQFGSSESDNSQHKGETSDMSTGSVDRFSSSELSASADKMNRQKENQESKVSLCKERNLFNKTLTKTVSPRRCMNAKLDTERGNKTFKDRVHQKFDLQNDSVKWNFDDSKSGPLRINTLESDNIVCTGKEANLNDEWLNSKLLEKRNTKSTGSKVVTPRGSKKRSHSGINSSASPCSGAKFSKLENCNRISPDNPLKRTKSKTGSRAFKQSRGRIGRSVDETDMFSRNETDIFLCSSCKEFFQAELFCCELEQCIRCSSALETNSSDQLPWRHRSTSYGGSDRTAYAEYEIDAPSQFVECPICSDLYSVEAIEVHAAVCGDT